MNAEEVSPANREVLLSQIGVNTVRPNKQTKKIIGKTDLEEKLLGPVG